MKVLEILFFLILVIIPLNQNIAQTSISHGGCEKADLHIFITGRRVFIKNEKDSFLNVSISTKSKKAIYVNKILGSKIISKDVSVKKYIHYGKSIKADIPLISNLKPGRYRITIEVLNEIEKNCNFSVTKNTVIHISEKRKDNMPIILWGEHDNIQELLDIGFTANLTRFQKYKRIWNKGLSVDWLFKKDKMSTLSKLDDYLINNFRTLVHVSPGKWVTAKPKNKDYLTEREKDKYKRKNKFGVAYRRTNTDASYLKIQEFTHNTGEVLKKTLIKHPAVIGALLHSEARAYTNVNHAKVRQREYYEETGLKIPKKVIDAYGVNYKQLKNFPRTKIINDENPIRKYYSWFWKKGDGWNNLNSILSKAIRPLDKSRPFFTFTDPAVRVPSLLGSGGEVDVLSHWTYAYPEPLKIGHSVEKLFAMIGNNQEKEVIQTTQLIWKKWELENKHEKYFVTIPPDILRETFWIKIAYPLKAIMYHGWESLAGSKKRNHKYRMTNELSRKVLKNLIKNVVQPLGPMLKKIKIRNSDVAFLECFTSQIFQRQKDYGRGKSWRANAYNIARWAQLQTEVIYEETFLKTNSNKYKIILITGCDIMTKPIAKKLIEFQKEGVIIIGDKNTPSLLKPDYKLPILTMKGHASLDKQKLQIESIKLKNYLDGQYHFHVESDNYDVLTGYRTFGNVQYIFVANDKRKYGEYLAKAKSVMAKGIPSQASIKVSYPRASVYDLVKHQQIKTKLNQGNNTVFNVDLEAGGGGVFLLSNQKIDSIKIDHSSMVYNSDELLLKVDIIDGDGQKFGGVLPLELKIIDPNKQLHEASGYYSYDGTTTSIRVSVAVNDAKGNWEVNLRELASNKKVQSSFKVK